MKYSILLREYRFHYIASLTSISSYASVLASSKLAACRKMAEQGNDAGKFSYVTRHNVVMRAEYHEWELCEAMSWDSLMGGL